MIPNYPPRRERQITLSKYTGPSQKEQERPSQMLQAWALWDLLGTPLDGSFDIAVAGIQVLSNENQDITC